jgi:murein DD-endopeptidase
MARKRERIGILDTFGLKPLDKALRQAGRAVFGDNDIPPTQWDLSSVKVFKPHISIPTWLGVKVHGHKAPIYNLYNRNMPGPEESFSVRVTTCRDFRGGQFTYDSHLGTDFAIPVGTPIAPCAPGLVLAVKSQFDHGGLKIIIDHGQGLITTYGHLSRALVQAGDTVRRAQPIALSGAAGMEMLMFFPWVSPHLHLNVVLNSKPVDPFGLDGVEPGMWRTGNDPQPHREAGPGDADHQFAPTQWDPALLDAAIDDCTDPRECEYLRGFPDITVRAAEVINHRMFYTTIFKDFPPLYPEEYPRRPVLDLPFLAEDYQGVSMPD